MGLISKHLEYRRLKKYYKKLLSWEHQMVEAGLSPLPPDFNITSKGNKMDTSQARYLHRMLDRLVEGERVEPQEVEALRKSLPELPKQKTLEEIAHEVHAAWSVTLGNDWKEELFGDLDAWLSEQHNQLRAHLEGVKSEAHPEFLETEADYEDAPEGTVVACDESLPWHKFGSEWSSVINYRHRYAKEMSGVRRRVLRWGDRK